MTVLLRRYRWVSVSSGGVAARADLQHAKLHHAAAQAVAPHYCRTVSGAPVEKI
ncbi:hypothetical protein ABZ897_26500 [Nonomuraea sp. NPDC046802]|uniref:hypothetical protein n=1 Tax=Nonomuraea sp. NPDC046802 TaxID=3154919 RepID=UPI0033E75993